MGQICGIEFPGTYFFTLHDSLQHRYCFRFGITIEFRNETHETIIQRNRKPKAVQADNKDCIPFHTFRAMLSY